jgi:phosphohistidine phosphatase
MREPLRDLLLLRHGIAEERRPGIPDGGRQLTSAGRARTRAVLERAASLALKADRLLSSPLTRARQTAEIAVAAGLAPGIELAEALEPGGDPLPLLRAWLTLGAADGLPGPEGQAPASTRHLLVLVGHEPDLGGLAARLLGAPAGSIALRKAGLALLRFPAVPLTGSLAGTARLEWLVGPKLLLPRP